MPSDRPINGLRMTMMHCSPGDRSRPILWGYLRDSAETARQLRAENREGTERLLALKAWRSRSMLSSEAPVIERMTLFWHNHFTSEARAVRSPQLMLRQHLEWRRLALGNYAELLRAVATDPAMLIYLDGRRNHETRPNENFARELLELFTLGEGHYGEADVRAASRALSGWTLDPALAAGLLWPLSDGRRCPSPRRTRWAKRVCVPS